MNIVPRLLFLLIFTIPAAIFGDILITQKPLSLYATYDTLRVAWQNTGRVCALRYGDEFGVYPLQLSKTGTSQIAFVPDDESMRPGIYHGIITDGLDSSFEFDLYIQADQFGMPGSNGINPAQNETLRSINELYPVFNWLAPDPGAPFYHVLLMDEEMFITAHDWQLHNVSVIFQAIVARTQIPYLAQDPSGYFNTANAPLLENGKTYQWMILNNYRNDPAFTSTVYGNPFQFTVNVPSLDAGLTRPLLRSPVDSATVSGPLVFTWSPAAGAPSFTYTVYLYQPMPFIDGTGECLAWKGTTSDTSLLFLNTKSLKKCCYKWKVVASYANQRIAGVPERFYYSQTARDVIFYTKSAIDSTPVPRVNITQDGALPMVTNDQGMAFSQYAVDETWSLHLYRPDFRPADDWLEITSGATSLVYTMYLTPQRSSFQGTVLDSATQRPLSGVKVYAISVGNYSETSSLYNGTYKVPVDSGFWRLFFEKDGYEPRSILSQTIDFNRNIVLPTVSMMEKSGEVFVQVQDDMGRLISGASVRAFRLDNMDTTARNNGTTNASGLYSFSAWAGTWTIFADKAGYLRDSVTIAVAVDDMVPAVLTLSPMPGQFFGYIMDADSQAIAGAQIKYYPAGEPYYADSSLAALDGSYTISVPGDTYQVRASKPGYITQSRTIVIASGQLKRSDFYLSPDVVIIKEALSAPENAGMYTRDAFTMYAQDNLFDNYLSIRLTVFRPEVIDLSVFDMAGAKTQTIAVHLFDRGIYNIKYRKNSTPGVFCVRAQSKTSCVVGKSLGF
jgi:hypothetical protein